MFKQKIITQDRKFYNLNVGTNRSGDTWSIISNDKRADFTEIISRLGEKPKHRKQTQILTIIATPQFQTA